MTSREGHFDLIHRDWNKTAVTIKIKINISTPQKRIIYITYNSNPTRKIENRISGYFDFDIMKV